VKQLSMKLGRLKLDPDVQELGPLYHVVLDGVVHRINIKFLPTDDDKAVDVKTAALDVKSHRVIVYYDEQEYQLMLESTDKLQMMGFADVRSEIF
jgi:hypothetical protein